MSTTTVAAKLIPLIARRIAAKREEDAAVAMRRGIDAEIIALLPKKEEGSVTEKTDDHKVTASFGLDRKVDTEAVQTAWEDLPADVQAVFKFSADVRVKELKALPEASQLIAAKFITTKPASTSLKLELA